MSQEMLLREKLAVMKTVLNIGFEMYPFKVQWYNDLVANEYQLPYDPDTVAVVVISTPDMFDGAFKQYLATGLYEYSENPLNESLTYYMQQVQKILPETEVRYHFDWTDHATILTQTASHVAGGAFYYQRRDVQNDKWGEDKKIHGISIHPRFGRWVSLDAVIFLKDFKYPGLLKTDPVDCVPTNDDRIKLLEIVNECKDYWGMTDIAPTEKTYSEEQIEYMKATTAERKAMVKKMIENINKHN